MLTSPYLLLIYATLFWAGNFTFGKALVEYIPPFTLSWMRWGISFLVFLPFAWKELQQTYKVLLLNWKLIFLMALTGLAMFNSLTYLAMQFTSSINAALMNSFTPVLVALMSLFFLKESLNLRQWGGISLSLTGVLWIISRGNWEDIFSLQFNQGDLSMGVAIIGWAVYSLVMKKYGSDLPAKSGFLASIAVATLILMPFAGYETLALPGWHLPTVHWLSVLYVSIFPSVISFICWNKALLAVGPAKASTYLHFIVLFASVFGVIFLGEVIMVSQIMGGILIISGVYIVTKPHNKKSENLSD